MAAAEGFCWKHHEQVWQAEYLGENIILLREAEVLCRKQSVSVGSKMSLSKTEYLCRKQRVSVGNRIPLWEAQRICMHGHRVLCEKPSVSLVCRGYL